MKAMTDLIVAQVRKNRAALYAQAGGDLRLFFARIQELEQQNQKRVLNKQQLDERRKMEQVQTNTEATK